MVLLFKGKVTPLTQLMRGQVGHSKVLGPPLQCGTLLGALLIDINFQATEKQLVSQVVNIFACWQHGCPGPKWWTDATIRCCFFLNVTGQLNTFWGLSWLSLYFLRLLRSQSATCIFHPVLVLIGILDGCWITPFHLPIDFSLGQTPLFWFVKCWHGVPRTSCRFLSQQGLDIYTKTLHLEYSFSFPDSACFDISPPQQCRSPSSLK